MYDSAHLNRKPWEFWLARGAVVLVIGLQLQLIHDFSFGPNWLAPLLEAILLIPLSIGTAWTLKKAGGQNEHQNLAVRRYRRIIRMLAIVLTALITVMNFGALLDLIHALLGGKAGIGQSLLLDAINLWVTNIFAFALWFWNIDRGGPALRGLSNNPRPDFLFPQYSLARPAEGDWVPGFVDYVFLAFTNATAFSPTDTLPLSRRAKLLMMVQAAISLLVVALVAARAVNILA